MALTKIKTSGIADNAITNAKMADDAIDSADFADGSIDNVHLAGSIAVSKTLLAGGTGLTLSTNTLAVDAAQTQITSVGTIGTGVWNGTAVASSYLDSDTAHLSVAQTYTENITVDHSASANLILDGGTDAHSVISWKIAGTQVGIIGYDNTDNILKWVAGDSGVSGNANGMYLNSSGNVGIGVSPSRTLHVEASVNDEYLVKFKNTHASAGYGVQILAGDSSSEKILTLQDKDGNDKQLFYADGSATFAGSVTATALHAKNTTSSGVAGVEVGTGSGDFKLTTYGSSYSTNGAFRQDGAAVDADDNLSGGLSIISRHGSSGEIRFYTDGYADGNKRLTIGNNGQSTFTGDIISEGDVQMANGRGISFTNTSNTGGMTSELLDDYEEGTWTATARNSVTLDSDNNLCSYTKIGQIVHCGGQVRVDNDNSDSAMIIELPFTSHASFGEGANYWTGAVRLYGVPFPTGVESPLVYTNPGNNFLEIAGSIPDAGAESIKAQTSGYYMFQITYIAA